MTIYLFCSLNQFQIPFSFFVDPVQLQFSPPHIPPDSLHTPHERAGVSRRRNPAAEEGASTPRAAPTPSQSQQRIPQNQEAAAAPRPPPPSPRAAGAEPATAAGTGDNLLRFAQSHPRHPRRLHGRRPAPHRRVLRRRTASRTRGRVAGGEAGLNREDEPVGEGEGEGFPERRRRHDVDVGGRSRGGSISRDTVAGAGNLAAYSGGGVFAGEGGANGVVVLERDLVREQLLGESVGLSLRRRGLSAAVTEPVQPFRLIARN